MVFSSNVRCFIRFALACVVYEVKSLSIESVDGIYIQHYESKQDVEDEGSGRGSQELETNDSPVVLPESPESPVVP